jgi:hypothetical protein
VAVLYAGIASEENLNIIQAMGYKQLHESRTKLKGYQCVPGRLTTYLDTKSNQTIRLRSVTPEKNTEYFLEVKSTSNKKKAEGKNLHLARTFE